jgi:hypothetical protein
MEYVPATTISERLGRLERENKCMKRLGAGILLGMVVLLIGGAKSWNRADDESIGAQAFILWDKNKNSRGIFTYDDKDGPCLKLLGDKEETRVFLGMAKEHDAPALILYGKGGRRSLIAAAGQNPQIILQDDKEKARVQMKLDDDGSPKLRFIDIDGETLVIP